MSDGQTTETAFAERINEADLLRVRLAQAEEREAALTVQMLEAQLLNARRLLQDRAAARTVIVGGVWTRYHLGQTDEITPDGAVVRK